MESEKCQEVNTDAAYAERADQQRAGGKDRIAGGHQSKGEYECSEAILSQQSLEKPPRLRLEVPSSTFQECQ